MRIAIVTETYPPEINGVSITIARLVEGLRQRQHQVQLIRPRQSAADHAADTDNFEEILKRGIPIPNYRNLKLGLPAPRALTRLWTGKRPDIVHIVTEGPLGWSALRVGSKLGIPVSTDFHTNFHSYSQHYGFGWLKRSIAGFLRGFHNRASCTLVPTQAMRTELEKQGFTNVVVVARSVDTRLFSPSKRSPQLREEWGVGPEEVAVIHVGRLAPEKNISVVLEAFAKMQAANPQARLILVGDGPARAALQARYPQHVFCGMRVGEDLAAHYASADIFLFPSITETYGNVTVEAMASGLAVVAYDYAAALQHIQHYKNGLLADFDNAQEFSQLAVSLVNDPALVESMRREARRSMEESLDLNKIIDEFEATLSQLANLKEPPYARHYLSPAAD
jgi:glycosyltransferase involved in cell wall biosynthesis